MTTLVSQAIQSILRTGLPEPWQTFGHQLSRDAAISTALVQAVAEWRLARSESGADTVERLFQDKLENLTAARRLLDDVMAAYDKNGLWHALDETAAVWNVEEALASLKDDFGVHPFPIVLRSLEFNWNYMKANSVRGFYQMTDRYLSNLEEINRSGQAAFRRETSTGVHDPYWLIRLDLLSIETPAHCDVCRLTIGYLLAARNGRA